MNELVERLLLLVTRAVEAHDHLILRFCAEDFIFPYYFRITFPGICEAYSTVMTRAEAEPMPAMRTSEAESRWSRMTADDQSATWLLFY